MENSLLRFDTDSLFVAFDFETFNLNLNFCHNRPWQITMAKFKGDQVLEIFDRYVKWDTKLQISKRAAEVTHFDPMKYEQVAVKDEEVYPTMKQWFAEAKYIVGHNILGFDVFLMKEWYRLNGDDPRPLYHKFIDTNCLAKAIKLNWPPPNGKTLEEWQYPILNHKQKGLKTRLEICGKDMGIEHDYNNLHNSLVDVDLNIKVFQRQKFMLEI
jgi:DNA polymerase III epsilon subunit-like protein